MRDHCGHLIAASPHFCFIIPTYFFFLLAFICSNANEGASAPEKTDANTLSTYSHESTISRAFHTLSNPTEFQTLDNSMDKLIKTGQELPFRFDDLSTSRKCFFFLFFQNILILKLSFIKHCCTARRTSGPPSVLNRSHFLSDFFLSFIYVTQAFLPTPILGS